MITDVYVQMDLVATTVNTMWTTVKEIHVMGANARMASTLTPVNVQTVLQVGKAKKYQMCFRCPLDLTIH